MSTPGPYQLPLNLFASRSTGKITAMASASASGFSQPLVNPSSARDDRRLSEKP